MKMVSKHPRKQRFALYRAPLHRRRCYLSAPLSRELREKHKTRALPVRKGDKVRVTRGDFKKLEGEVLGVDTKRCLIQVQGAAAVKADGRQVNKPIVPSNVVLIKLASDKEREKILERRFGGEKGAE